jgi:exodeoxyribonuclease V alpha subunit
MNVALSQLSPLSRQFAAALLRLDPTAGSAVIHAAWLASETVAEGHVCVDLAACAGQRRWQDAQQPGVVLPPLAEWVGQLRASRLVGGAGDYAPLILDQSERLYLARYWRYECILAADLLGRAAMPCGEVDMSRLQADLDRLFGAAGGGEPDWQRAAAEKAVLRRLCVISGGPGTGKTSTVVRILAALQMHYHGTLTIRLAAPTGKAAARMQEAVRNAKGRLGVAPDILAAIPEQAATLHRLLGSRPDSGKFRHGRAYPLPLDVLVVDEASMIDLALMAKLVEAMPPGARLILLGDKDQLASVEAGAVFGDICAGAGEGGKDFAAAIALLHKSYRFGADSGIGKLAQAIRLGDADRALAVLGADVDEIAWHRGGGRDDSAVLVKRLRDGYREYLDALRGEASPAGLFDLFGRFRALCAHREGSSGVAGLNQLLEDDLRRAGEIPRRGDWYHGRPVMVTQNEYNLALFNGDIGIAMAVGGELRVVFQGADGRLRDFAPGRLPPHETVYAMTVHKSQGSEFDEVMLVLPDDATPVVNRALVYTAVTRARRRIELWGRQEVLVQAVGRAAMRTSGLKDRLWPG